MCGHVRDLLGAIGKNILDGNVAVSPYKTPKMTACKYCSYSSVCQFDTAMRDNRYRFLADLDDSEVWRLIREQRRTALPMRDRRYLENGD